MRIKINKFLCTTIIALPVLLFVSGCELPLPEPESAGAKLYVEKCALCHPARHPGLLTADSWSNITRVMEKKVKSSGVRPVLTDEETKELLEYLTKHSRNRAL